MNLFEYEQLIVKTSEHYNFALINRDLNNQLFRDKKNKICFLRHDIDLSPANALAMAELEAKLDVSATYTVLLSSQHYNAFEKETRLLLSEIKDLGHEVGLHFDPSVYNISSEEQLNQFILREKIILEDLLQHEIEMFSFHNTTKFSMSCRAVTYGGLQNAYSNFFHNDVEYTSDSNGYWRFRTWQELLAENHKKIQVLTHPIWWKRQSTLPPFETVVKNSLDRFYKDVAGYTSFFDAQTERQNISIMSGICSDISKCNDANTLNAYAQFPRLLSYLSKPEPEIDNAELAKIFEEFFKC